MVVSDGIECICDCKLSQRWLVGVVVGHVAPMNDGGGARD